MTTLHAAPAHLPAHLIVSAAGPSGHATLLAVAFLALIVGVGFLAAKKLRAA